jgi:hypothetical protein
MRPELLKFLATSVSYAELEILADYSRIGSDGTARPIMYPGLPFRIHWRYWSVAGDVAGGVPLVARILSEDRGTTLYTSLQMPYAKGGVGEALDSPPLVCTAENVNRIGAHQLLLQIEFPASALAPVEATADYIMETPSLDWTTWLTPVGGVASGSPLQLDWNTDYQIQANYVNPTADVSVEGKVALGEYSEGSVTPITRDTQPLVASPGLPVPLLFAKIRQDWSWLVKGVWVMHGDRSREFRYELAYAVKDQFNNSYTFVHGGTDDLDLVVIVSERKWALGAGAMAATILAAILLALVWLIGPGLASAAYAVAGGLGAAALDPPSPDPAYRRRVRIGVRRRRFNGAQGWLRSLADALLAAEAAAAYDLGLYAIEGRMLGAIRARDAAALRRQRSDYASVLRKLTAAVAETSRLVDLVLKDPASSKVMADDRWRRRLGTWASRRRISGQRRSPAWANRIVQQPELVNAALSGGLSGALEMLRGGLIRAATAANRDHGRVKKLVLRQR